MPQMHITPVRSDILFEAYQGEHFRYHGQGFGQARRFGVALKGGVNVTKGLLGSEPQEWG